MQYGVLSGEDVYHEIDDNEKLLCTHFSPQEMDVVGQEKTFGKELCGDCRKRRK